ncbi:MAG: hypothetical protein ACXWLH_00770 [Candidatus Saccharimonadales bacterium]
METSRDPAEAKPRIGLLPEVTAEVLVGLKDEVEHPVREHVEHLADEQPRLFRELLIRADSAENSGLDARQALMMGAMFAHEALHEQAARQIADQMDAMSDQESAVEPKKRFLGTVSLAKLGGLMLATSVRRKHHKKEI